AGDSTRPGSPGGSPAVARRAHAGKCALGGKCTPGGKCALGGNCTLGGNCALGGKCTPGGRCAFDVRSCARQEGSRWARPGSVEAGALGTGALELEEAGGTGDEDAAVPQATGGLALRGGRDHRAEERDVVEGHDRGTDVLPDLADALLVGSPQRLVELVGGGVAHQLLGQADLGERLGEHGRVTDVPATGVVPGAERVVQRLDVLLTVELTGGVDQADRPPGLVHQLPVVGRQVTALV